MTASGLTGTRLTPESRQLSHILFGREHQLEVAVAATDLEAGFVVEDLVTACQRRAADAELPPPKGSAVRKSLDRLVRAGAVDVLPSPRPGTPSYYSARADSAFWAFAADLLERG